MKGHRKIRESYISGSTPIKFDVATGTIYDPKIWGKESKNGLIFTDKLLKKALSIVLNPEKCTVYKNHIKPGVESRDVDDIFGKLIDPYIDSNGELRAKEFKWNTQHEFHNSFVWILENTPQTVGFSVSADVPKPGMKYDAVSQKIICDDVTDIDSFDMVAGPANTGNILESAKPMDMTIDQLFEALAGKITTDSTMDTGDKTTKLKALLKLMDKGDGKTEVVEAEKEDYKEEEAETETIKESAKYKSPLIVAMRKVIGKKNTELDTIRNKNKELENQVNEYKVKEAVSKRLERATAKGIPSHFLTTAFRKSLEIASTDDEVSGLIDEQYKLFESTRTPAPTSGGSNPPIGNPQTLPAKPKPFDKEKASQMLFGD